ncbi:ATP-dependent RNA helicase DbpA [Marinobacter zhejiangensis]|uniref:ATP-independent RNA helicase DbpA n=1 Tax=Marinobacter zhejiangensis TaxID=488535 RepID=A0A1I4RDD4_9GAMM|nr:ATP-dependent RNA helicase DbpA [Marinobacter zhejiangensis]SFM50284.1 ATP-independent RNA helicase DbpA [Marinobacter zhejiangensis]
MPSFNELPLSRPMLRNLSQLGYDQPTQVQSETIPSAMAGKDVIAMAKTGSGKTAAFGVPLVEGLNAKHFACQGLVLCPTRELADQVAKSLRQIARAKQNVKVLTLCGGVAIGPQIGSLSHGAHLIVGTPGRIQDHLRKGTLSLEHLKTVVLDEADRMLDMGFREVITDIFEQTPDARQTLMFSATWPQGIRELSACYQREPVDVRVEGEASAPDIEEHFYRIAPGEQGQALMAVLSRWRPSSCIAFCTTKQQCDDIAEELNVNGFSALAIHGDLEQRDRDAALVRFANGSINVLVATDVAARGLDIKALPLVVNVEPARDGEVHTHRVGRTGRAGESGHAVTLCTPSQEHRVERLDRHCGGTLVWGDVGRLLSAPLAPVVPVMATLCISGGRKDKIRPGDLLGALTGEAGLPGKAIGKIDLFDFQSFVAVEQGLAGKALKALERGKIKGRKFRVRLV